MNPCRLIFEGGVKVELKPDGVWVLCNTSKSSKRLIVDPNKVTELFKLRPLVLTQCSDDLQRKLEFLLPKHIGSRLLDIETSELLQSRLPESKDLQKLFNLNYIVGSVIYHCKNLATVYDKICENFLCTHMEVHDTSDTVIFSYQPEAYYEFDALVTSARRAYDTTRYILWQYFGPGSGSVPRSFKKCLPLCNKLPEELRETLESSWNKYGESLTNYRDCIQHYIPVDFGISSIRMEKLDGKIWTAKVLLPDNPEAQSKNNFKYTNKIDALDYGWEIATEIVNLAKVILSHTVKVNKSGTQQGAQVDA